MTQCVDQLTAQAAAPSNRPFLAADVGGTHARVGLVHRTAEGRIHITDYTVYTGADFANLGKILHRFMTKHAPHVSECALACAGYLIDGIVINGNLPWAVNLEQLRRTLNLEKLSLINDFEALAHAVQDIEASTTTLISACSQGADDGPVIVVGPGTGLGSAVLIPNDPQPVVVANEAGQINLAPGNALEARILAILARTDPYVSYERVLSGPGLINLYRALGECLGKPTPLDTPKAITHGASLGNDALARQTLDTFCALLGSFVGNLVMLYKASGGVYLAGGIVSHIREFLLHSDFLARFLAKGETRIFLERVPVRMIEHGQLGVIGAAKWHLKQMDKAARKAGKAAPGYHGTLTG